jgi:hypothetical protein
MFFIALVFMAALSAQGAPGPALAAPDCIQMDLSRIGTLCAGEPTMLNMTVENACSASKRVSLTFAVDHETIRERAAIVVEPLETLAQHVLLPLPATIESGRHVLTVSVKDAAGNVRSTDVDLAVDACTNR